MPLNRIDRSVDQPEFLPVEIRAMRLLADKHEQYQRQARDLEARAMHRAYGIVFRTLKGDFYDTEPTQWDSL